MSTSLSTTATNSIRLLSYGETKKKDDRKTTMSSRNTPKTTWIDITPDVLLQIVSDMDPLSRINVAIAYPEIFMRPGFDVFLQDAEQQVRRYNSLSPTPAPFTETPDNWPLLHTAIECDVDIQIVEKILETNMSVCSTSIDGIWGEYFTALRPPLTCAAILGKPRVVKLLLEKGADPLRLCANNLFRWDFSENHICMLTGMNHTQCTPIRGPLYAPCLSRETGCLTPMKAVLARGLQLRSPSSIQSHIQHQALEECAMMLYDKGAPLPPAGCLPSDPFVKQIANLTRGGFFRLAKAILDPLIPLKQGDPAFRVSLARL
ncbi:hypothetical protein F5X97DRAFT_316030 [Nemania serpens]|nr:hypothetical protein F5X97DRAFT_316030 [Nemania serpens]